MISYLHSSIVPINKLCYEGFIAWKSSDIYAESLCESLFLLILSTRENINVMRVKGRDVFVNIIVFFHISMPRFVICSLWSFLFLYHICIHISFCIEFFVKTKHRVCALRLEYFIIFVFMFVLKKFAYHCFYLVAPH